MIYLLHFNAPYKHARHYVGFSDDIAARLEEHRCGRGARLLEVITAAGIGFTLAGVWKGGRHEERRMHKRGGSRVCPICHPSYKSHFQRMPRKEVSIKKSIGC